VRAPDCGAMQEDRPLRPISTWPPFSLANCHKEKLSFRVLNLFRKDIIFVYSMETESNIKY